MSAVKRGCLGWWVEAPGRDTFAPLAVRNADQEPRAWHARPDIMAMVQRRHNKGIGTRGVR